MDKSKVVVLVVVVGLLSFIAGILLRQNSSPQGASSHDRRVLYYVDPMHPAYKSDKPGIAPDCGMALEPVYEGADPLASGERLPAGAVTVSPEKQQLIGIRVEQVENSGGEKPVRLLGRVAADERHVYFLNAATDGWIQDTFSNSTGTLVKKDEVLATCYAPEFQAAEQAYFYALNALDRLKASGRETPDQIASTQISVKQAADGLRNLGMGEVQVQALARERRYTDNIEIRSPATGFLLERNVSRGLRFERGKQLYRIADLSRVWVLADVYDRDRTYIRPGTEVRIRLPGQGETFHGLISSVPAQFDPTTRTLKVRIEVNNPALVLLPDMFVDVDLPAKALRGITVPADAVLDTGRHQQIFVARGEGRFEPRVVHLGARIGDRVEIVEGLTPGEQIVVSGNFLLDSESRMRAAAAGVYGASSKDPVCGMDVDEVKAKAEKRTSVYRDKTYYFCSRGCKEDFDKNPEKFVEKAKAVAHASPAVSSGEWESRAEP